MDLFNDSLLWPLVPLDGSETCWDWVPWMDYSRLMLTIGLVLVDMLVVFGNCLVIIAVITHRSLHTTTNFIIMSLATSDFLLGVFVLPFSISQEMLVQVWPFGTWLCRMWLAIDVWMCTASIYNLVAISFDRFMAVTQPLRYKLISSVRMGRLLVALAWIVSFMICLPPLVVPVIMDQLSINSANVADSDNSNSVNVADSDNSNSVNVAESDTTSFDPSDNRSLYMLELLSHCSCSPMNNDDIYVIYSAMGSFIVPWAMIIGLNFGIYYTALRSGMAMKSTYGKYARSRSSCTDSSRASLRPNEPVVLRVHRGGCYAELSQPAPKRADSEASQPPMYRRLLRRLSVPSPTQMSHLQSTTLSTPTSYAASSRTPTPGAQGDSVPTMTNTLTVSSHLRRLTFSSLLSRRESAAQPLTTPSRESQLTPDDAFHYVVSKQDSTDSVVTGGTDVRQYPFTDRPSPMANALTPQSAQRDANNVIDPRKQSDTWPLNGGLPHGSSSLSSRSPLLSSNQPEIRATITNRARRRAERAETRVAKTISVVVGCFTVCWVPFTIIYVMQAYDICTLRSGCVPKWLFTITFWMGYSNSAFNPIIYALFSRDFRRAFKSVLSKLTIACRARRSNGLQAIATKANVKTNSNNARTVGNHQRVPLIAVDKHATEVDILLGD